MDLQNPKQHETKTPLADICLTGSGAHNLVVFSGPSVSVYVICAAAKTGAERAKRANTGWRWNWGQFYFVA